MELPEVIRFDVCLTDDDVARLNMIQGFLAANPESEVTGSTPLDYITYLVFAAGLEAVSKQLEKEGYS